MSEWTSVCGAIRIDSIFELDKLTKEAVKERFGNTCSFDSPKSEWDACNVPCGSEGSLQYEVIETGGIEDTARFLVAFWGDLRDFNDPDAVFSWVNRVTKGLTVRGAAFSVNGHAFHWKST